jgi:hypothetical protein
MYKFLLCLLVLFILGLPGVALAQVPDDGTIDGQVVNETGGDGNVGGLEVCLFTYVDKEIQRSATTRTDDEGKFRFVNLVKEYKYLISVTYMDVDYYYPVVFSGDESSEYMEVAVCDTTKSDDAIKVVLAHKIIDFEEESAIVTEMFVLMNEGDHTYVGGEESIADGTQGILVFTLPHGATAFGAPAELAGDFQLFNDNKVNYDVPFPPGERQIIFTYNVPIPKTGELNLSFMADYPTDYLDIMIKSDSVEVSTGQLAPAEPVVTDTGDKYIHFTGQDISRDSVIDIYLVRVSSGTSFIFIIVFIVIVIIIIAILVYFVIKKRAIRQKRQNTTVVKENE